MRVGQLVTEDDLKKLTKLAETSNFGLQGKFKHFTRYMVRPSQRGLFGNLYIITACSKRGESEYYIAGYNDPSVCRSELVKLAQTKRDYSPDAMDLVLP